MGTPLRSTCILACITATIVTWTGCSRQSTSSGGSLQNLEQYIADHRAESKPSGTSCRYENTSWQYNGWGSIIYLDAPHDADVKVSTNDGGSRKIGHVDGKVMEVCVSKSGRVVAIRTATSSSTLTYIVDTISGKTKKVASSPDYNPRNTIAGDDETSVELFTTIDGISEDDSQLFLDFMLRTTVTGVDADEPSDEDEKDLGTTVYQTGATPTNQPRPGLQVETTLRETTPSYDQTKVIENPVDATLRATVATKSTTGFNATSSTVSINSIQRICVADDCSKASWSPDGKRIVFFGGTARILTWSAGLGFKSFPITQGINMTAVVWLTPTRIALVRGIPLTFRGILEVSYIDVDTGREYKPKDDTYLARPISIAADIN